MNRWNLAWILLLPGLLALGLIVQAQAPAPDEDYQLVRTIVDVLAEVDKNYVRDLSPEDKRRLVEDMINGGLDRLDEHSRYFNEEELKAFDTQTEGQFAGIGISLTRDPRTQYLKVEAPIPGTPAYEAGVLAGDLILKVDGQATDQLRTEEARARITGKPGTSVKLTLAREGDTQLRELDIARAMIQIHAVKGFRRNDADPTTWDWLADPTRKIALIRLVAFSEKTDKEVRDAVAQSEAQGATALILDLRQNPGGLLSQAAAVADCFLTDGAIVSTADQRGGKNNPPKRTLSARPEGTIWQPAAQRPMVVLINRNSASAAEIVAAALQDHGRAFVIGERSFGKGSVQKVFPLNQNRAAVKLTTEVWLTPTGKNIHRWPSSTEADEWGVRPSEDGQVNLTPADRVRFDQILRQLDQVAGKPGIAKGNVTAALSAEQILQGDPVLRQAIDWLRAAPAR